MSGDYETLIESVLDATFANMEEVPDAVVVVAAGLAADHTIAAVADLIDGWASKAGEEVNGEWQRIYLRQAASRLRGLAGA